MALRKLAAQKKEEMQPTKHSRALKTSVQRFKVEGEAIQPHFFQPKSLASF
jgi:hypothetical protein